MFYQSAVASVLFYDAVCWGGIRNTDAGRLVRKVGFVIGKMLEPVTLISHFSFMEQKQQYWRILVYWKTEKYRESPPTIELFNSHTNSRLALSDFSNKMILILIIVISLSSMAPSPASLGLLSYRSLH